MIVYALFSADDGVIQYIGATEMRLRDRLSQHRRPYFANRSPVAEWARTLDARELEICVLEECQSKSCLEDAEQFWIASIRATGARLLNVTDGGDRGGALVGTAKLKQIKSLTGKLKSPEHRAKIRQACAVNGGRKS